LGINPPLAEEIPKAHTASADVPSHRIDDRKIPRRAIRAGPPEALPQLIFHAPMQCFTNTDSHTRRHQAPSVHLSTHTAFSLHPSLTGSGTIPYGDSVFIKPQQRRRVKRNPHRIALFWGLLGHERVKMGRFV
jgi:hypothetical protein